MARLVILLLIVLPLCSNAQNVGIGTNTPIAKLSVDSGLNIDQANVNGFALESALTFGNNKKVGIGSRRTPGTNQAGLDFYTQGIRRMSIDSFGNVGIGNTAPAYRLQVSGSAYFSQSAYILGYLGLGTSNPDYAFTNLSGYNYMFYNLGIGTVPTASYRIDVDGGPVRFRQDLRIDGTLNPNNVLTIGNNTVIEGTLTVSTNKGIVRSNNSTQVKVIRTSVQLSANIGAGAAVDSGEFGYETFGGTPQVYVGNMTGASNSSWASLQFIPFEVDANSCKFRVFNHGSSAVNVQVTYAVLIIGPQ